MSGLEEAIEAGARAMYGPKVWDGTLDQDISKEYARRDARKVLLAAAPALLKAVVAEIIVDLMEDWDDTDLPILQAELSRTLLAALSRLTAGTTPAEHKGEG